jgi:hypothetical protein
MRRLLLVALVLLALSQPALAWDPFVNELDPGDQTEPDPVPLVVPEGIYLVTDVYAGDTVTRNGPTTTYSTVTVREMPGTYARVLESVGTGARSDLDGASFNGRASLPDGRAVAGTYYEDFVLTSQGFVSVNVVFFQDDSLTIGDQTTHRPPVVVEPSTPPPPGGSDSAAIDDARDGAARQAPPRQAVQEREHRAEDAHTTTAGVSLSATGPILSSIEVLRGRTVSLWPRVFVDGRSVGVRSWRIVAGAPDIVSATSGSGSDASVATWLTLAAPGSAFTVRFDVTTDVVPGLGIPASISVIVRSPALLE